MTAERLKQIEDLYHASSSLPASQRRPWLVNACRGDDELRKEVESLLKQADRKTGLLGMNLHDALAQLSTGAAQVFGPASKLRSILQRIGNGTEGLGAHESPWLLKDWLYLLLLGLPSVLKTFTGLTEFKTKLAGNGETIPIIFTVLVGTFLAGAVFLIWGGRRDQRALDLAVIFLLVAATFADPFVEPKEKSGSLPWLTTIHVESYFPLAYWTFVRDFPVYVGRSLVVRGFWWISLVTGTILFYLNDIATSSTGLLERHVNAGVYWAPVFILSLGAIVFSISNLRKMRRTDRRRLTFFWLSVGLALSPITLAVLVLEFFPEVRPTMLIPSVDAAIRYLIYCGLATMPFTTAYAVLVNQAIPTDFGETQKLQYSFARRLIYGILATPLTFLCFYLYDKRNLTVAELFAPDRLVTMVLATSTVAAVLLIKRRLMDSVDRAFFREPYDAQRTLGSITTLTRNVDSVSEFSHGATSEIRAALHLHFVEFLPSDILAGVVAQNSTLMTISRTSDLASLLASAEGPVDIPFNLVQSFPDMSRLDKEYLTGNKVRILIPLTSRTGNCLGAIAIGEKQSRLGFSLEDRKFFGSLGHAISAGIENLMSFTSGKVESSPPQSFPDLGQTCLRCRHVMTTAEKACANCGGILEAAQLPKVLNDKFRIDSELGRGGMGVVYLATDLELRRKVALKTLPRLLPAHTRRLRREAIAMASVKHRNLAMIFGTETWNTTPVLVVEYLEGETLQQLRRQKQLGVQEIIKLGIELCHALETLHASGILHRDIKPSNIGYSQGVPKLLDFGLAQIVSDKLVSATNLKASTPDDDIVTGGPPRPSSAETHSLYLVGTPPYMSPEALRGEAPSHHLDLWGLAVVLAELCIGSNPLTELPFADIVDCVERGEIWREELKKPQIPAGVRSFVLSALSPNISKRPRDAAAFRRALSDLLPDVDRTQR